MSGPTPLTAEMGAAEENAMETQIAPKSIATSTYRRANGSQAIRTATRRPAAVKVQARSHTPSPEARRLANSARVRLGLSEIASRQYAAAVLGR